MSSSSSMEIDDHIDNADDEGFKSSLRSNTQTPTRLRDEEHEPDTRLYDEDDDRNHASPSKPPFDYHSSTTSFDGRPTSYPMHTPPSQTFPPLSLRLAGGDSVPQATSYTFGRTDSPADVNLSPLSKVLPNYGLPARGGFGINEFSFFRQEHPGVDPKNTTGHKGRDRLPSLTDEIAPAYTSSLDTIVRSSIPEHTVCHDRSFLQHPVAIASTVSASSLMRYAEITPSNSTEEPAGAKISSFTNASMVPNSLQKSFGARPLTLLQHYPEAPIQNLGETHASDESSRVWYQHLGATGHNLTPDQAGKDYLPLIPQQHTNTAPISMPQQFSKPSRKRAFSPTITVSHRPGISPLKENNKRQRRSMVSSTSRASLTTLHPRPNPMALAIFSIDPYRWTEYDVVFALTNPKSIDLQLAGTRLALPSPFQLAQILTSHQIDGPKLLLSLDELAMHNLSITVIDHQQALACLITHFRRRSAGYQAWRYEQHQQQQTRRISSTLSGTPSAVNIDAQMPAILANLGRFPLRESEERLFHFPSGCVKATKGIDGKVLLAYRHSLGTGEAGPFVTHCY